jgi:hypothetical protein
LIHTVRRRLVRRPIDRPNLESLKRPRLSVCEVRRSLLHAAGCDIRCFDPASGRRVSSSGWKADAFEHLSPIALTSRCRHQIFRRVAISWMTMCRIALSR